MTKDELEALAEGLSAAQKRILYVAPLMIPAPASWIGQQAGVSRQAVAAMGFKGLLTQHYGKVTEYRLSPLGARLHAAIERTTHEQ